MQGLRVHRYNDFARFYWGIHAWLGGGSLYQPTSATWIQITAEGAHLWNLNPPHLHLILLPLSALRIELAAACWLGLNLAGCLYALSVGFQTVRLSPAVRTLIYVAALASAPTVTTIITGQLSGLLAALVAYAWQAHRNGRQVPAAICWGLALSVKPFLLPVLGWLLFRREFRMVAFAIGTAVLSLALGAAVFGASELIAWVQVLRDVRWLWLPMNTSLFGIVDRAGGAQTIAWGLASILGLVGFFYAVPASLDRGLLILLATIILVSPVGWLYYWWLLFPLLVGQANRWHIPLLIAGMLPPWFIWTDQTAGLQAVTTGSIYAWALLVGWLGCSLRVSHT